MSLIHATDSYLSLMLSLPGLQPMTVLSLFFLTLARLLPILALAPFFGTNNVPMTIRMMFGVALTAIFLPQNVLLAGQENITFAMPFVGLMLKELLIGLVLGVLSIVPFVMATMAGSLINFQSGGNSLGVTDPTTRTQTGPTGILFNWTLIAIFFAIGGPFIFLQGVATSYQLIPVDGLISHTLFSGQTTLWTQIIALTQKVFNMSIQFAAPSLIGILFTDMFLGIANRLAPQVQIVFLGISLKSWVGLALLAAAWTLIIKVMSKESLSWFKLVNQLIYQVGHLNSFK